MRFLLLLALCLLPVLASAQVMPKPDDRMSLTLSSEDWVVTKTARTVITVNAAVTAQNTSATREAMMKAVKELVPEATWRITSFNRSQAQTGLENWTALYEARLAESALTGLNEKAVKASRPGIQLSVSDIDFTPTLEETESVRAALRKLLMDKITAELKIVNASFPGRDFRVSEISFGGAQPVMAPRMMVNRAEAAMAPDSFKAMADSSTSDMQTSQKITLTATVTFAAAPAAGTPAPEKASEK